MIENCKVNECEKRLLVAALATIIAANKSFRAGMPEDWEGDPLQDAVDSAGFLLIQLGVDVGSVRGGS